ncbi:MAG TPA: hypothetical protein DFR83_06395 [Deltaproteobacteria bacterium]|nr:hypothetical protein [Deltaproteobacteria bacterium]
MLYQKIADAMEARKPDEWSDILHPDFEFVRHQSGTSMNKEQTIGMMRQFMASDAVQEHSRRCIYENDDILVAHSVMSFADGTSESVIAVYTKKDGMIIRSETGATPIKR